MVSQSQAQTIAIGRQISQQLQGGDVLFLLGELGAGKTTLVKGIAAGLGIKKEITSPTFALMNIYDVRNTKTTKIRTTKNIKQTNQLTNKPINKLVHIDTYRLKNEQELVDIGALDYLGAPDTVCVVEWPEKIEGLLKGKKIKTITIEHNGENRRSLKSDFTN